MAKHYNKMVKKLLKHNSKLISCQHLPYPLSIKTSANLKQMTFAMFFRYLSPILQTCRFVVRTRVSIERDQVDVRIALSMRAKGTPLEWIMFNNSLCAVLLDGSVCDNNGRLKCPRLFVLVVHAPNDCSSRKARNEFY